MEDAIFWYNKAAEQGDKDAKEALKIIENERKNTIPLTGDE